MHDAESKGKGAIAKECLGVYIHSPLYTYVYSGLKMNDDLPSPCPQALQPSLPTRRTPINAGRTPDISNNKHAYSRSHDKLPPHPPHVFTPQLRTP